MVAPFKVLNVAEKNDAAKNIAEIMSGGHSNRREGLSRFNKIYEYQYMVQGTQANMVMTSVSGHLLNMEFPEQYRKWWSCHPVQLFDLPVEKGVKEENMINIKKSLEKEIRGCKLLIIWTDCDREGENIGMEVVTVCRAINRGIKVLRAKFSEITRPSIERAMRTLGQINENVAAAVDCRMELDLRIGAAFTRFQTMRLQKMFPNNLSDKLISYGSCQFPTMGFVVERYKAIENFTPEPFWKLKVTHEVDGCKVDFTWKRVRLFHQMAVQVYKDICMENTMARVEECKSKPKNKWRPLPLDTVELEKLASRKLKISAKTTMTIAEKLYTQGLISYPRTETNSFPKEMNLTPLVEAQTGDNQWGAFAGRILGEWNGPHPRAGKKSDQAHPPIHPIKHTSGLQGDEAKVYEFIVRHFLACVSQDAVGKETTVNIDIAGEKFVGHGLTVLQRNYLEVYVYDRWSDKEIIDYEQIREFEPSSIDIVDGSTEAPKLLTEADLIALMDKHGIGTDATHAEHIETVKSREYVFIEDRDKLVPGKLAMALVEGYDAMGFCMSKPDLRAGLETDLAEICEGRKDKEEVLRGQVDKYREVFQGAIDNVTKLDQATQHFMEEDPVGGGGGGDPIPGVAQHLPVVICSSCQAQLVLKTKASGGWMVSCQGYPACRVQPLWLPDWLKEASLAGEQCRECNNNPTKVIMVSSRGSMAPFYPDRYTGCLGGCEVDLLRVLGVDKLNSGNMVAGGTGGPRGRGDGRGGRGTNRGGVGRGGGDGPPRGGGGGPPRGGGAPPRGGGAPPRGGDAGAMTVRGKPKRGGTVRRGDGEAGRGRGRGRGGHDSGYGSNTQEEEVTCQCSQPAARRIVQKEGSNQGREFYCCPRPREEQCGFFQWADEEVQGGGGGGSGGGGGQVVNCNCGLPSARRTVQKEGANKGRDFLCCTKQREEQCGYFQWADEVEDGHGAADGGRGGRGAAGNDRGRGGRGGAKRRLSGDGVGGEKKQRKCGLCQEPGHVRTRCPMKEDWPDSQEGWN